MGNFRSGYVTRLGQIVEDVNIDFPSPVVMRIIESQKSRGQWASLNHQKQGKYTGVSWEQG